MATSRFRYLADIRLAGRATLVWCLQDPTDRVHVLIAGGGVAALEAALALRHLAEGRVSVELLAPEPHFWYRPLAVAAPFKLGEVQHFELEAVADARRHLYAR